MQKDESKNHGIGLESAPKRRHCPNGFPMENKRNRGMIAVLFALFHSGVLWLYSERRFDSERENAGWFPSP
jgi:hypothetical protein